MALKPLLACTVDDLTILRLPMLASPKLDGIRAVVNGCMVVSRNGKPIPNAYVQAVLGKLEYQGLDGELIVGPPSGPEVFNRSTSGVMSMGGEPDFNYWVFDNHSMNLSGYETRLKTLPDVFKNVRIKKVPQTRITSLTQLADYERNILGAGFEGVMLRRLDGPYKQGRSTLNEQILLRLKRFQDGEATVIDIEEGQHNGNAATLSPLGYVERSTHQDNMRGNGRVGTIIASDDASGQVLRISPGKMTQDQRVAHWLAPQTIIGRTIKYKCFNYGAIDAPRFATFQAFLG